MDPDSPFGLDLPFLGKAAPPLFSLDVVEGKYPFAIWFCRESGEEPGESAPEAFENGKVRPDPPAFRDSEAAGEKWRNCRREAGTWEHYYRLASADGRARHLLSRGLPVCDAEGRVLAWVGVDLDVTAMKETEEDLRQVQERFRVALESGCDLLYECDLAAGSRRWFGPVDELLGFAREGFPRTEPAWEDSLHPEDRERVLRARKEHMEGRVPFHVEYRVRRGDGAILHWLDRGKVMRDRSGTPLIWIGFVTDMTERRRSEEMLRKSEESRRASQGLEVIGRLAGGIAHDFNNLLTAINGYSEMVLAELGDESELAPPMKEVLKAGERAATLTRQLLAFSRRQVLAPKVLDLNAVIADMRKMLGEFLGPGIEIAVSAGEALDRIKADPAQVEQVVLNLALNAKDAMPKGGRLLIETRNVVAQPGDLPADAVEAEPRSGPYVLLTVRDFGVGMDEETQSHLFEPFYSTKGRAQGLGLSAVYGIMKQSGGHIAVASKRGEGTVIRLFWPSLETVDGTASAVNRPGSTSAIPGGGSLA